MKTVEQKLIEVEASMRRWHSRLTRAANALRKLDAKRRRLLNSKPGAKLTPAPIAVEAPPAVETDHLSEAVFMDFVRRGQAAQKAVDDLTIPEEFRVTADAEALRAERRKREEAERKAMPKTGREALAYIKSGAKKKTARSKSATA